MNIDEAKLVSLVTSIVREELDKYYSVPVEAEPIRVELKYLFDYMLNNRKIDAIKEYRQLTGAGLKEAEDEVERIMDSIKGE